MKTYPLFSLLSLFFFLTVSVNAALLPFVIEGEEATWVKAVTGGGNSATPFELVELTNQGQTNTWLHVGRPSGVAATSGAYYNAGDLTATENNQFADFTGSVIFMGNMRPQSGRGIAIRGASQGQTNSASGAFRSPNQYLILQRNNTLGIYYGADWSIGDGTGVLEYQLAVTTFRDSITYSNNTQYQITFSVIGSVIEADIWLWDAVNNVPIGESLAHVSYAEATEREAGYVGLRGVGAGAEAHSYYRDFHLTVIPEPVLAISLLVLGLLSGVFHLRAKRLRGAA